MSIKYIFFQRAEQFVSVHKFIVNAATPSNRTNRLFEVSRIGHAHRSAASSRTTSRRVKLVESDFGTVLTSRWGDPIGPIGENGIW